MTKFRVIFFSILLLSSFAARAEDETQSLSHDVTEFLSEIRKVPESKYWLQGNFETTLAAFGVTESTELNEQTAMQVFSGLGLFCLSRGQGPVIEALTELERFAICLYTEDASDVINRDLEDGEKDLRKFTKILDRALEKFPASTVAVERGAELTDKQIEKLQVGEKINYKGYLSASSDYPWFREAVFKIQPTNAKDISAYASLKSEIRFLFPRKSKFEIKGVTDFEGVTEIQLSQEK